jgi:uncharacterized protein (DUF305 family)
VGAGALLSLVFLGACATAGSRDVARVDGAPPPTVQPGAPGAATRVLSPADSRALPRPPHTAADVAFMQGMIPHHVQALEMTALVQDRTADRNVRLLALRIELSQMDEINLMKSWLRQRNEPVPGEGEHGAHVGHGMMPGMLTATQMAALAAASDAEFDRLFLTYMIQHHEGAVNMVKTLFASPGGGQQSEMYQFASDVEADQEMEIARMRRLLADR